MKLVTNLFFKKYFHLLFYTSFSVATLLLSLETALQNIDQKLTVKSINGKSIKIFFYRIIPCLVSCIESICTIQPLHCQLSFYFSNINYVAWIVNYFSIIEWFQQTLENHILVAAKLKHPRNYKKLILEGISIKLQLCCFVKFITFVVAVQHIYSL